MPFCFIETDFCSIFYVKTKLFQVSLGIPPAATVKIWMSVLKIMAYVNRFVQILRELTVVCAMTG